MSNCIFFLNFSGKKSFESVFGAVLKGRGKAHDSVDWDADYSVVVVEAYDSGQSSYRGGKGL